MRRKPSQKVLMSYDKRLLKYLKFIRDRYFLLLIDKMDINVAIKGEAAHENEPRSRLVVTVGDIC